MAMALGPSSESLRENSKVEGVNEFRQVGSSGGCHSAQTSSSSLDFPSPSPRLPLSTTTKSFDMLPPPPDPLRAEKRRRVSQVAFLHSPEYLKILTTLPFHEERDAMLMELLCACGLMSSLTVVRPVPATRDELEAYHDPEYLEIVRYPPMNDEHVLEEAGLIDDCGDIFPGLWSYCLAVAGASIQAANLLCNRTVSVAINFGGGRHHARKDHAEGFCWVNDIVLAILRLRKCFKRIMYLDVDCHHSNAVQEAFYYSDRVLHISIHCCERGFYPGTGSAEETGAGKGKGYSINVPLHPGCSDETFETVFLTVLSETMKHYAPECIVVQCGADGLSRDRLGRFNLSTRGYGKAIEALVEKCGNSIPLLVLGGGGYNAADTARLWTILTAAFIGRHATSHLPFFIPENEYFDEFSEGGWSLHTMPLQGMKDENTPKSIQDTLCHVREAAKATSERQKLDEKTKTDRG